MFAGAYWGKRAETRDDAARRLLAFLESIRGVSEALASWYPKVSRKPKGGQSPVRFDAEELAAMLKSNRKDVDRTTIDELGFNLGLWNGRGVSLSATVGAHGDFVSNSVVLAVESGIETLSDGEWHRVIDELTRAFDPDAAAVASTRRLSASPAAKAWEVGWLTYRRGDPGIVEHAERH